MTTATIDGIKNDVSNTSEEELEKEFHRLRELGLHELALQVEGIIAEKRVQFHIESGREELPESAIYDSFEKFKKK